MPIKRGGKGVQVTHIKGGFIRKSVHEGKTGTIKSSRIINPGGVKRLVESGY